MKNNRLLPLVGGLVVLLILCSCAHKSGHKPNAYDSSRSTNNIVDIPERKVKGHTKVRMEKAGGVYLVPIKVNGLNLKFIFDTGASSICLSSAEALVMLRQGQITQDDFVGQQQFQDATGGISVGTIIRLHTVEIGGIVLRDVEANIVDNIQAPLLLGQTALSKFGKVTIDYNNNIIEFN
jgi:aspartyl protease family protein